MRDTMLDDMFRDKMNQYDSPVADRNWEKIAEALKKDKRRRFAFWWRTLLPGLIIVVLGTGAYTWYKMSNSNIADKNIAAVTKPATDPVPNHSNNNTVSSNNETVTNNNSSPVDNASSNNNSAASLTNDHSSSQMNDIVAAGNNTNSTSKNLTSVNATRNSSSTKQKSNIVTRNEKEEKNYTSSNIAKTTAVKNNLKKKNNNTVGNDIADQENNGSTFSKTSFATSLSNKKKAKKQNDLSLSSMNKNEEEQNQEFQNNFSLAMMRAAQQAGEPSFETTITETKKPLDCPTPFGRRGSSWFVDGFVSPNYISRSLTNNGNQIEFNKKDSSESLKLSFSGGINVGRMFGNHFSLKTGLTYSLTTEKFNWSKINSIKDVLIISVKKIVIAPGDTVYVYDTSHFQQIGRLTTNSTNRYHSFDVPLIFGYETKGDNIRFNINAGVIFNITTIARGKTLSVADSAVDIKSSGYFKNSVGFSLFGSVMMLKRLNDNLDFFVEPYFRQGLGNMATDKAYFKQTLRSFGLNLGFRYKFNLGQR